MPAQSQTRNSAHSLEISFLSLPLSDPQVIWENTRSVKIYHSFQKIKSAQVFSEDVLMKKATVKFLTPNPTHFFLFFMMWQSLVCVVVVLTWGERKNVAALPCAPKGGGGIGLICIPPLLSSFGAIADFYMRQPKGGEGEGERQQFFWWAAKKKKWGRIDNCRHTLSNLPNTHPPRR